MNTSRPMTRFWVDGAPFFHDTYINSAGCLRSSIWVETGHNEYTHLGDAATIAESHAIARRHLGLRVRQDRNLRIAIADQQERKRA